MLVLTDPGGEPLDQVERLAVGVLRAGAPRGFQGGGQAAEVGRLELAVRPEDLDKYLAGAQPVPTQVFLVALDIVAGRKDFT